MTANYWLLYYGDWVPPCWDSNHVEPYLTYCANIGKLPYTAMERIAEEHQINYRTKTGAWCKFRGFHPSEVHDGFFEEYGGLYGKDVYEPFYEITSQESIPEDIQADYTMAIHRYMEAIKCGVYDEAIKLMQKIVQIANCHRALFCPPAENSMKKVTSPAMSENVPPAPVSQAPTRDSLDFSHLTSDKGKWVPTAEFAKLRKIKEKDLENWRSKQNGGTHNPNKTEGIDAKGNCWVKMGKQLKSGKKGKQPVCYYWVPYEDSIADLTTPTSVTTNPEQTPTPNLVASDDNVPDAP